MLAQSLQSCLTLCNPMDHGPPGSPVHGILQARMLEWAAISFSRGVFLTQGLNSSLLYFQGDSLPLSHQGSPSAHSSIQFSHSVMSDSLQPRGLQYARPPCPSPTPRVYSNSYPLRRGQWQPSPVLLPGKSPWMQEPGGLQSTGSHRVGHD